jgi:hypothetical protein
MSAPLSREDAIGYLAKALFWKMEHLDPTDDFDWSKSLDDNWSALDDHGRSFYTTCIDSLLCHDREIRIALGEGMSSHDDSIDGSWGT